MFAPHCTVNDALAAARLKVIDLPASPVLVSLVTFDSFVDPQPEKIDEVLLIGGSTRMPRIVEELGPTLLALILLLRYHLPLGFVRQNPFPMGWVI